jgi:nucleotidyltransferase/DNA polymerase involved in DNA repair
MREHVFVLRAATILHADLDAFYASVEQRDDPRLRGRPVIVGGGVVLAASYEAKACGVRTAMGGRRARRICPDAIVVEPRMAAYSEASKAVYRVFDDTTPLVEGLSIDEAFLDVRGMERIAGTPTEIAARLRRNVLERVGLPITVGVARTKFLAKVASGVAKPDGLLVVPPDGELAFLHPLPIERLWGVGTVTAARLRGVGIQTVGEVAGLTEETLVFLLGPAAGRHLHALAHNRDPRPVQARRRRGSIGSQRALGRSPRSLAEIDATILTLVDRVTRPNGGAQAPLRRLLTSDSLAHPAARDRRDACDRRDGERTARSFDADDPGSRPHTRRHRGVQPRRRHSHPARAAVRAPQQAGARRGAGRAAQPVRPGRRDPRGAARPPARAGDAAPPRLTG